MNGLSKELIDVLEYMCKKIGIVLDWTDSNIIPQIKELCEKYVQWEIHTSLMWICFGIFLIIIGIISFIVVSKFDDMVSSFIAGTIFILPAIIIIMSQTNDIITCIYFPEKQIYEYLSSIQLK